MLRRRYNNFFQKFAKSFLSFSFNFETIVKQKFYVKIEEVFRKLFVNYFNKLKSERTRINNVKKNCFQKFRIFKNFLEFDCARKFVISHKSLNFYKN